MSGICAVLRLDGKPAERSELAPVLARLAARGPDAAAMMEEGPAALGHALLATTPEALTEPMPFRHAPTGCMITADVRLDNRAELIAALGLEPVGRVIGDGELILLSYLRWGMDCPAHLLGDFAFTLWDPRRQRLFCVRDKVGMRQLIYHHQPGKLFACATDTAPLLYHREVPRRINEARIADFIEQFEAIDLTATWHDGLHRLPPAHALVVENGALRLWRYWQLTPPPMLRLASNAAYEEAFRAVFTEAVRARLRSPDPVGSMLSGGIDSGSVTAVAAGLLHDAGAPPLKTFSAFNPDPGCKESGAIRAAMATPHIAPRIVSLGDPDSWRDEVVRLTRESSDPFDGHMTMIRALYVTAQRDGIKVMLDGVAGDTSLPTGDMIAHHLGQWHLRTAWREARAQERFWSGQLTATKELSTALRHVLLPASLRALRIRQWEYAAARRADRTSLVDPALAARVNLPARRLINARQGRLGDGCDAATQALRMLRTHLVVGRERYDRVAGAVGIEPRDPFLDQRVLEFCLTLPVEQIHADGWPKLILRRAMAGLVADSVRWKTGRDHIGWRFTEICAKPLLDARDETTFSLLRSYVRVDCEGADKPLQCSTDGVVSQTDLLYLASWLTWFKSLHH